MIASRTLRFLSLGLAAAVVAACGSDGPTGPQAGVAGVGDPDLAKGGMKADAVVYDTITVDPATTQVYKLGTDHFVYIPAGSVCTLDTPYGPEEWDKPCERLTQSIDVHAVIVTRDGIPSINFYPDLRFAPAADDDYMNWVFLGLKTKGKPSNDLEKYAILYRPTFSVEAIDESLADPTLRAFRYDGKIVRRLKHFSGYNVSLGFFQEQSGDLYTGVLGGM